MRPRAGCRGGARRLVDGGSGCWRGTAQPLVKEEEQESDLDAFSSEAVGVARSVSLQQAVPLELAEIVTQLVETVALLREAEGGEDGLMDLLGRPAADLGAAVV